MVDHRRSNQGSVHATRNHIASQPAILLPKRAMKRRKDSRQLTIDWNAATAAAPPAAVEAAPPAPSMPPAPPEPVETIAYDPLSPVQVLPWDFQTTFPPPQQDAIDAGVLSEEDAEPQNLAALHAEHTATLLAALKDLDAVHDARRRGVDPATGKAPRSQKKKQELPDKLSREIERLERWQQTLLDTYEAGFGATAAQAFNKYVRARHANIEIIVQPVIAEPPALPPVLPTPTALRESMNAGVFGEDENGPVDPSPEEVLDITKNHAEALTELVEIFRTSSSPFTRQQSSVQVDEAVQKYAADFAQAAANQLLAYCHRQAILNRSAPLHRRPS